MGIEPGTSRSRVRCFTTAPQRSIATKVFQQPDQPPTCGSNRLRKLSSCRPEVGRASTPAANRMAARSSCRQSSSDFCAISFMKEQIRLVDLVGHRHVKLRPRYAPWGRQKDLPDGPPFEPVLGLLFSHLCCRCQFLDGCEPLPVASGAVV